MPGPNFDIPFPKLGLNEYASYTEQPPLTTPSVKNWVLRDPSTGRARGAKRAGTTRYVTQQVNSTNAIQCLVSINRQNARVAYTAVNSGNGPEAADIDWQAEVPDNQYHNVRAMDIDRFGNIYAVCGRRGVIAKFGADGVRMWTHTIEIEEEDQIAQCIAVDFDGDVYVGIGGESSANQGTVYRFRQVEGGLELVWNLAGEFTGLIADIAVEGQWMYVAENTSADYILHRYGGVKTRSPAELWSYTQSSSGVNTTVSSLAILPDGSCVVSYRYDPTSGNKGRLAVVTPDGKEAAIYGATAGGTGYGCAVDPDGAIWSFGPQYDSGGSGDDLDTVVKLTIAYSGSWAFTRVAGYDGSSLGFPGSFQGPDPVAIDRDGRCYIGLENGTGGDLLRFSESAGTISLDWQVDIIDDIRAVQIDPYYPVAADDATYGTLGAEFVFLGTDDAANSNYSLHKVRVLDAAITDSTPRSVELLAVSNGTIKKKASASSWTTPTGGSSALDINKLYVRAAAGFDRVYFTDGEVYKVYNPQTNTVAAWRADEGRLPPRCKLLTIWSNRLVLARGADDPFNWYMSKVGDFDNWDFFPYPATVDQAVAGNNAPAGVCPDVVNALIPYSDDLLLFGGDRSIWRLTGDPADGGRFDMVSDITGVAFGNAWCKDSEGVLYFMGSRGGVFAYAPGMQPKEISNTFIRERLAVIDFSAVRVEMAWNDRERCVMLFIMPTDTSAPTNYIYDVDNGGWWPFDFSTTAVTADAVPSTVCVVDGDAAGDRAVLIGTHGGYVWYWNVAADADDDGVGNYVIDADIYIGPMVPFGSMEAKLQKVYPVMGANAADTTLTIYGADSPDFNNIGSAQETATIGDDRTTTVNLRARGQALWFRLQNNTAGQRVQFESLRANVYPGSRVRVRT